MSHQYVLPDYLVVDYILETEEPSLYSGVRVVLRDARLRITQSETRRTKLD